jgi:isoleucyl-tRNA synthetase
MTQEKKNWRETLNLLSTDFPMKADLANREPARLARWEAEGLYRAMVDRRKGAKRFVLHDGPPYANGHIHIGHALNKILKDTIVKYRAMTGHQAAYVPGWDCHGLPIEHQVDKELGAKKEGVSTAEKRKLCREYAGRFISIQRDEFKRLGVLGDWENPYLTMAYEYEAKTLRELGRFVGTGAVYKGLKPVHWCSTCRTALAEAEVEYGDHVSPSVHVKFPFKGDGGEVAPALAGRKVSFVIWTTTPWTIPSNLAVALHPDYKYVALDVDGEACVVAAELADPFRAAVGAPGAKVLADVDPKAVERKSCRHPFLDRDSLLVLADYVTLDAGTGCVHTAPGHGREDYETGLRYGLEVLSPLDDGGRFTARVPLFEGLRVFDANPKVVEALEQAGALLAKGDVSHSYPHCWRCRKPLIFRATAQWFISMEKTGLRRKALDEIAKVRWIPTWGRNRIESMMENRPDWCISRQRSWGVPIAIFRCAKCGDHLLDESLVERVVSFFEKEGADAWFDRPASDFLPGGTKCPSCGHDGFEKETDILDVWFDSGVSYAAVCEGKEEIGIPVDLYLEGSDQHRGWFHSTLLAAAGTRGHAPYKAVLTHGFVVDGKGEAMSKSKGNVIAPAEVIRKSGAEILRLWVSAEDYRGDVKLSDGILGQLSEAYRKIRNTIRFLLMNLSDFDPARDSVPFESMGEMDRFALSRFRGLAERVRRGYDEYEFHRIYQEANNFCAVDLSSFYLDVLKDRLYCSAADDPARRSAQTVLFETARGLVQLLAPVLSFTADEAWEHLPAWPGKEKSVFLSDMVDPEAIPSLPAEATERWERILSLRGEAAIPLEAARNTEAEPAETDAKGKRKRVIGANLDAKVTIDPGPFADLFPGRLSEVREALGVSVVATGAPGGPFLHRSEAYPGLVLSVERAPHGKCERCWTLSPDVGSSADEPELCARCAAVVKG